MLEEVIFGNLIMPGEILRLVIAIAGMAIASYFDVFNKRNVPDNFLYGFLLVAFMTNLIFYQEDLFLFSIASALFFSAIAYVFYRAGQIGGADVIVMAAILLLLPIQPSFVDVPFNIPFFFPIWLFAGVSLALVVLIYFGHKVISAGIRPDWKYGLMFIPYILFAYFFLNSFLFSWMYFIFISISLLTTIFFLMYRKHMNKMMAEEMPVTQLEPEDVLALDLMDSDMVKENKMKRLMTKDEIERLKKLKIGEVWVFTKLPPFIPFLLLGTILSIFLSDLLFFM
jgi:Flp pilus assembly protein protease CpaA